MSVYTGTSTPQGQWIVIHVEYGHLTSVSSTSNKSLELGGILGGIPDAPYLSNK